MEVEDEDEDEEQDEEQKPQGEESEVGNENDLENTRSAPANLVSDDKRSCDVISQDDIKLLARESTMNDTNSSHSKKKSNHSKTTEINSGELSSEKPVLSLSQGNMQKHRETQIKSDKESVSLEKNSCSELPTTTTTKLTPLNYFHNRIDPSPRINASLFFLTSSSSASSATSSNSSSSLTGGSSESTSAASVVCNPLHATASTLIVMGGVMELGDMEVTLDDVWAMDLHRRNEWRCYLSGSMKDWIWKGEDDDATTEGTVCIEH